MNEEPQAEKLPLWQAYADELMTRVDFGYGSTLPFAELEKALRCSRETAEMNFALIGLNDFLRTKGFLLTRKGMRGEGLRVADKAEMAEIVRSQEWQKVKHSAKNAVTLGVVDTSDLSPEHAQRHQHWAKKAAIVAAAGHAALSMRKLPDSPEVTTKSLRQAMKQPEKPN